MGLAARVRALVAHRSVLWLLVRRDLKVRYASSALGYVWTVLDPFMMILIYWFVFSLIFRGRDVGEEPYILYLAFGQLAWQWFNGTVNDTTRALTSETRLVRQVVLLTGIGLLVSAATVLVRDLARVVRIVLRMAFYATPILYSVRSIHSEVIRELYALNPLTGILDLYRASVFSAEMASARAVALSAAISLLMLVIGAAVFARLESPVLKEL